MNLSIHTCEDAADRPHVDSREVVLRPKENIRGSVPQGDDFVSVVSNGDTVTSGKPEICDF